MTVKSLQFKSAVTMVSVNLKEDPLKALFKFRLFAVKNKIVTSSQNSEIVNKIDILQHVFNASNSGQTLGNVFIEKSNGVHIGNITYVTGPIHITQAAGSTSEEPKPNSDTKSTRKARSKGEPKNMNKKLETATNSLGHMNINSKDDDSEEEVEREEVNCSDAFIGNISNIISKPSKDGFVNIAIIFLQIELSMATY